MVESRESSASTLWTVVLGVGFATLSMAVVAAYTHPAASYELSIYRRTPELYWVGLAVAVGTSLLLSLFGPSRRGLRGGTFLLAYAGFVSFVALPVVRGYYYLGAGDSLTHLGLVKDLAGGTLAPFEFLYPAVHLTALWTGSLLGVEFTHAIQLVVVVFFALFLLFVPLCVRTMVPDGRALLVGLFSAGLFLPINNVSVFRMAYPFGQAVLFFPVVLYVVLRFVRGGNESRFAFGVTLLLTSTALILVHPQLGLGVVLLLAFSTAFQYLYGRVRPASPVARHRSLAVPTVSTGAFYLLWIRNKPPARSLTEAVVNSLQSGLLVGDEVARTSGSAGSVGTSIEVMAFKLFFVSAVFSLLAGALMVLSITGHLRERDRELDVLVKYLTVGIVPLLLLFAVLFVTSIGQLYFRYVGAITAVVTILGAVALAERVAAPREPSTGVRTAVAVLFAVLVPLSLLTVYFSPYILRGSGHVTEQRMSGYETAFEHRDDAISYVGIRRGPDREAHAVYGLEKSNDLASFRRAGRVPADVFDSNLSRHYGRDWYFPVSESSYRVEVGLYDGFRYSERGFRRLQSSPGIDRVQSNGEFHLYLLRNERGTNRSTAN